MIGRSNFMKRLEHKASKSTFDIQLVRKKVKTQRYRQHEGQLFRADINNFLVLGIFDKKVIAAFNQRLQVFGFFDFHAIHQRIRYEFYRNKLLRTQDPLFKNTSLDEAVIQKQSKAISPLYGQPRFFLMRIDDKYLPLFKQGESKTDLWGVQLQKNNRNQLYVVSSKSILGKQFSNEDISAILANYLQDGKRIPKIIDDWIGEYSCKSAYKFNDTITLSKAKLLILNLSKCDYPWHCVHGRNTVHIKTAISLHT